MLTFPFHTGNPLIDGYSLHVTTDGQVITHICFATDAQDPSTDPHEPLAITFDRALSAWHHGDARPLRALPLAPPATPWAKAIRTVLHDLPLGVTLSYTQLARRAQNPRAVRAAASACSHNPFPLIIPCHAVIPQPAQNKLDHDCELILNPRFSAGNYAFGADLKHALLRFEYQHSYQNV
ncbi:methylated-DNA--[protein]-cysteine S-methyltransferase [Arcanobacterium phocae]|uniref:methylated-DNA--[protein]-cysteine S-methyltransferase n=1 Tax=Arcanobacterium phocae TaxID=131112 RepID=UPI001C0F0FC9|nr:methylated-DNA--[protein]-cysteine S-methyltransferase [Arcanobacterium phocae]